DPLLQQFAMEVAQDERNHVAFLQTAITNASSIAEPTIDLFNSFNALAVAAGIGPTFDPFASEANFLLGAFIFEDVGVTAYHGAAGLITSKSILDKAAGILAVEAYHAGAIRTHIYGLGTAEQGLSQQIAAARAVLDGTGPSAPDDIGVTTLSNGAATVVDGDVNAIAFARTTLQVRQIAYAVGLKQQPPATNPPTVPTPPPVTNALSAGGFFPTGMNGPIR
ncbi:MAG TPA: ferritin-like domain-containing protein, partial [Acidisarcina sp.]